MSEPLYATAPVQHSPGACLPLTLGVPFVAFGLFVFVDGDGEQLAQVGRGSFVDEDLGRFFEALRSTRPDVVFEHR